MNPFSTSNHTLTWRSGYETLIIQPWGTDSLRVRATRNPELTSQDWALLPPTDTHPIIELQENTAIICNGQLQAEISINGELRFSNLKRQKLLLQESPFPLPDNPHLAARQYKALEGGLHHISVNFSAWTGERFYGLGQHQHGLLDQKGCVINLAHRNTEIAIPFLLSSRGYGFLWNNPALGRVELSTNRTSWVAEVSRQIDYWITAAETPAEIMKHYADATGHTPPLPEWAAGFWQSKLRYATQNELLEVAREYYKRGLPLSVIVIDGLHWTMMGDWKFDPTCWPDPAAMTRELESMGIHTMVSIWPMLNALSPNYATMSQRGLLVGTRRGLPAHTTMVDNQPPGPVYMHLYDATHPEARRFIWEKVCQGYYKHGVKAWWLDACEPEFYPGDHDNLQYHLGDGLEVGNLYPMLHQQAFYDGMRQEGETEIITLGRSAWAGSQRYGAAVWSGDIASTFEALRTQLPAGLNIGLSGIPWWTTDIGGFHSGDPATPYFRELIVRWFQYGVFCPLFRLHGFRLPVGNWTGAPNEIWSFGEPVYTILKELLFLRQRLKPYILTQMQIASQSGIPIMRPLFFDFPTDPACIAIDDQFMFGSTFLVAPILETGMRSRPVYLPAGAIWRDAWTGQRYSGGQWLEAEAPLDRIPYYERNTV